MYDEGHEIFDCPCLVYDDPGQDYSGFGDDDGSQASQLRRSFIRLLHAAPNVPVVDVLIGNRPVAENLAYRRFTTYLPIGQGRHRVRVFPAGDRMRPVLDTTVQVGPNSIATIAVIGTLPNLGLLAVPEPRLPVARNKALVRFAHLSPNTPRVDVVLPRGAKVFSNVGYREVTDYRPVDPGTYAVEIRATRAGNVLLVVPGIRLMSDRRYTVYAVGLLNQRPRLQALVALDGSSYLPVGAAGATAR